MKILYLVYHGLSKHSGISKKILYQIEGLRSLGNEVHICTYDYSEKGNKCRFIDGEIVEDYGHGAIAFLKGNTSFGSIIDFVKAKKIQFVYIRSFHNANPWTIGLVKSLHNAKIKNVIEIPTYPYDNEYADAPLKWRFRLFVDKIFRKKLASLTDAIVTFSNAHKIFGQKTIRISNGIDFDALKARRKAPHDGINLLGVAEVHYWHGYDRVLSGLGEYLKKNPGENITFHIVGGIADTEMNGSKFAKGFKQIIEEYNIQNNVKFHGQLFGPELDKLFDMSDFAIGSLGRHRTMIKSIKTLKNREYAARGMAFCYSEDDSDFNDKPYVIRFPADESPVDIAQIINIIRNNSIDSEEIRSSISSLSWNKQMETVINEINKL